MWQFFHPRIFCAPAKGIGIWYAALRVKKTRMMGFIGPRKKFNDIFSHVGTIHQRVRQTDGHRTAAKTALLRMASRGKNDSQQNM